MASVDRSRKAASAPADKGPFGIVVPGVRWLTPEEGWQMFDDEAQRELGMGGRAFMAAWDRGDFAGREDELAVARVLILAPGDWYNSLTGEGSVARDDSHTR